MTFAGRLVTLWNSEFDLKVKGKSWCLQSDGMVSVTLSRFAKEGKSSLVSQRHATGQGWRGGCGSQHDHVRLKEVCQWMDS